MKIAQIAPFEESVPPRKYGGTELVVHNLTEGLLRKKHRVYLIATGDSKTNAKLLPVFPEAIRRLPHSQDLKIRDALKFIGIGTTINYLKKINVDIVHNHLGWRLLPFLSLIKAPIITTLHGPLDIPYHNFIYRQFKKSFYVSISNNQRQPLPDLQYVGTVYNGIEVEKFTFSNKEKNYLAFLGRTSPEKGLLEAIQIAKKSGMKLKIAAKIDIVDKKFFEQKIKPLIDGTQIEFIGEVNHTEKVKLLKYAKALLAPLQWREPFGLFMTESMACGTPVIVFDRGSAKEVVEHGKTGFVVKNVQEAVEAVKKISQINRSECQERVEKYFDVKKMVNGYEEIYQKIIRKTR